MQASQLIQHAEQLHSASRLTEAADFYRQAILLVPDDPALHYSLGNVCLESDHPDESIACYSTALELAPDHPQILLQLGNAYSAMGVFAEAVTFFQRSIRVDATDIAAHFNLGNALRQLGQPALAAASYTQALKLAPDDADTHNNLGNVLRELGRLDEAIACYESALKLNPALYHAKVHLVHQKQHICDWAGLGDDVKEIRGWIHSQPQAQVSPFAFLSMPSTTAEEQRKCAENWVANRYRHVITQGKNLAFTYLREGERHKKLRIGYLSADFRLHPLAFLISELIESHDRSSFEVYAYSYAVDDKTAERKRLEQAFDHFVDIRPLSQLNAAKRINDDQVNILVDLTGFTQSSRSGIAALRPAPINVSWLGFPGTMGGLNGVPLFDYILSDAFITPLAEAACYSEKLALLPDCYQPNNRKRPVGMVPNRSECGLPENAFVFCCFNQSFKITPQIFQIWIRLLNTVPGSVLWLLECNQWAKNNLRREAHSHGIDAGRLIFAPRVQIADHLARHALADLFLDTLPYNAHTTTSDALWMGLPVLTCVGDTFASRVAGSLLKTANLPELITYSLDEYENRAAQLASNPNELNTIKQKIHQTKTAMPLFDTPRFVVHLEQAYQAMWQTYVANMPAQSFSSYAKVTPVT